MRHEELLKESSFVSLNGVFNDFFGFEPVGFINKIASSDHANVGHFGYGVIDEQNVPLPDIVPITREEFRTRLKKQLDVYDSEIEKYRYGTVNEKLSAALAVRRKITVSRAVGLLRFNYDPRYLRPVFFDQPASNVYVVERFSKDPDNRFLRGLYIRPNLLRSIERIAGRRLRDSDISSLLDDLYEEGLPGDDNFKPGAYKIYAIPKEHEKLVRTPHVLRLNHEA